MGSFSNMKESTLVVKKVGRVISHAFNMFPVVIVLAVQILGGIGL